MEIVTAERVFLRMAREYRHSAITPENESEKLIALIKKLLKFKTTSDQDIMNLLDEVIRIIASELEINEVSILLLDKKDKKYRYVLFYGLRKEVVKHHKELAYALDEIIEYGNKSMKKISDTTFVCFAENRTEEEAKFFNLHINKKRAFDDDYIEGDFFDTYIYDSNSQFIGYIEYTGTKKNKMPPAKTILIIELMVAIIGTLLSNHYAT